jgi:hypothetical protein
MPCPSPPPFAMPLAMTPQAASIAPPAVAASTPTLTSLRQREQQDTGGGFKVHYSDPELLRPTPPGSAGTATGVCGAAPLPTLKAMHKVAQLKRLQREGAHLVAELPAGFGQVAGR